MQTMEPNTFSKKKVGFALHPENINRNGIPPNPEKRALNNALKYARRNNNGVEFLHHIADQAYKSNTVALAVLDKLIPNATPPKVDQEEKESPKFILVFNNGNKNIPKAMAGEVHSKPEEVSGDVLIMGNGKNHVFDSPSHDIHGVDQEQPGSDLSQGVHRPKELNGSGLREILGLQGGQQQNGHES